MLYHARLQVRPRSDTNPGITACSSAKAALRSVPMPFSIPRNAIGTSRARFEWAISGITPTVVSSDRTTKVFLLPIRSARSVTKAVAAAAPARPAAMTTPIAAEEKPTRERNTPSTTPSSPSPHDRNQAAAEINGIWRAEGDVGDQQCRGRVEANTDFFFRHEKNSQPSRTNYARFREGRAAFSRAFCAA